MFKYRTDSASSAARDTDHPIPATKHSSAAHLRLSSTQNVQREPPHADLTQLSLEPSAVQLYTGPGCYVKPKAKSNMKIVINAISNVCLAGEVNLSLKKIVLAVSN